MTRRLLALAAPAASFSDPPNAVRTGTGSVTISGLNFGVYCFTPTGSLEDSSDHACTSTSWTSATSAACRVQTSRGSPGRGIVRDAMTVVGVVGTRQLFTYDGTPLAQRASRQVHSMLCRCAGCATDCGVCFGCDVRFAHVRQYSAEPSFSLGHVALAVGCAAPVVSSSDPINMALTGGGIITIGGLSFAYSANVTPTSSIWMSGACGSTAWTSLTAVSCTSRAYAGGSLCLGVTLSAQAGTRSARFSFDGASYFAVMAMVEYV